MTTFPALNQFGSSRVAVCSTARMTDWPISSAWVVLSDRYSCIVNGSLDWCFVIKRHLQVQTLHCV